MKIFIITLLCLYLLAFVVTLAFSQDLEDFAVRVFIFLVPIPLLSIPMWLALWLIRLALGS